MKKLLYIAVCCVFFGISACLSQDQQKVPKAVKDSFQAKYPDEDDPDWHKDKNGNFEANFKKKKFHYRADFNPEGKWIETERSMDEEELPEAVKERLDTDFEGIKIIEIEEVEHNSKGLFFDVELKIEGKKKDIEFTESGAIINQH